MVTSQDTSDFWGRMRDLRSELSGADEQEWSRRLRRSLAPTARRGAIPRRLVADLERLQDSELAERLDLGPIIAELLAMVRQQESA